MKIAFSISTYDAIQDMHIAASLIRDNWDSEHDPYIIATLAKPGTRESIDSHLFDCCIEIEAPNTPYLANIEELKGDDSFSLISSRLFHSIILAGRRASSEHCDYIVYLNSGSWILDLKQIIRIINELGDRTFAARMLNRRKYLMIDDHFLIVNIKKANEQLIFDIGINSRPYNALSLSVNGIHGMLRTWLNQSKYGEVYLYSDSTTIVNQYCKPIHIYAPFSYDPENKLLHSNSRDLTVHFLRKMYIEKFVGVKGDLVQNYVNSVNNESSILKYYESPYPHYKKTNFKNVFLNMLSRLKYMVKNRTLEYEPYSNNLPLDKQIVK